MPIFHKCITFFKEATLLFFFKGRNITVHALPLVLIAAATLPSALVTTMPPSPWISFVSCVLLFEVLPIIMNFRSSSGRPVLTLSTFNQCFTLITSASNRLYLSLFCSSSTVWSTKVHINLSFDFFFSIKHSLITFTLP